MEPVSAVLATLGTSLANLAVKGTASAIDTKIRTNREQNDLEKTRIAYEEIINEILQEREEAVRIAQAYKSELEKIVISDKDIEQLNSTFEQLLILIVLLSKDDAEKKMEQAKLLKGLINMNTLKTMQLLGFNYKAAIGEPLTELCANAISSWGSKKINVPTNQKRNR